MELSGNKQAGLIIWGTKRGKKVFLTSNISGDPNLINNQLLDIRTSIQFSRTGQQFYSLEKVGKYSRFTIYRTLLDWVGRLGYMAISVVIPEDKFFDNVAIAGLLTDLDRLYTGTYVSKGAKPSIQEQPEDKQIFEQVLKKYPLKALEYPKEKLSGISDKKAFTYYKSFDQVTKLFESHQKLGTIDIDLLYLLDEKDYDLKCNYTQLKPEQLIVKEREIRLLLVAVDFKDKSLINNLPIVLKVNNKEVFKGPLQKGEKLFDQLVLRIHDTVSIEVTDTQYHIKNNSGSFKVRDLKHTIKKLGTMERLQHFLHIEDLNKQPEEVFLTIIDAKNGSIVPHTTFRVSIDGKKERDRKTNANGVLVLPFKDLLHASSVIVRTIPTTQDFITPAKNLTLYQKDNLRIALPTPPSDQGDNPNKKNFTITEITSTTNPTGRRETYEPPRTQDQDTTKAQDPQHQPSEQTEKKPSFFQRIRKFLPIIAGVILILVVVMIFVMRGQNRTKKANLTLNLVDSLLNQNVRQDQLFRGVLVALEDNKGAINSVKKSNARIKRHITALEETEKTNYELLKDLVTTKHRKFFEQDLSNLKSEMETKLKDIIPSGDLLNDYSARLGKLNISNIDGFSGQGETAAKDYISKYKAVKDLYDNAAEANGLYKNLVELQALAANSQKTSEEETEQLNLTKEILTSTIFCYVVENDVYSQDYTNLNTVKEMLLKKYAEVGHAAKTDEVKKRMREAIEARETTSKYYAETEPCI